MINILEVDLILSQPWQIKGISSDIWCRIWQIGSFWRGSSCLRNIGTCIHQVTYQKAQSLKKTHCSMENITFTKRKFSTCWIRFIYFWFSSCEPLLVFWPCRRKILSYVCVYFLKEKVEKPFSRKMSLPMLSASNWLCSYPILFYSTYFKFSMGKEY